MTRSTSTSDRTRWKAKENNWGSTVPGKGWFVVFRFYGPLGGYINKTWVLNDIELID
jgi:hypothetical protein